MDVRNKTEAEQQDFFDRSLQRFEAAANTTVRISHFYNVADTVVRLVFAGDKLVPLLTPALEHLRIEEAPADVTFNIWDSSSTNTKNIKPPVEWDRFTDRGDIWGFNSQHIRTGFHWIECSVNLFDRKTNTGIYWVESGDELPFWVHASPLRTLFHWWMEKNGCQLLHAAAVGTEEGAVLITGKGGVGKSTTALTCLTSELTYLADDYLITRLEPEPKVYSLYSTAKLNADQIDKFPALAKLVTNPNKLDREKAVIFLYPEYKDQIRREQPLRAVLTPSIQNQEETDFASISHNNLHRAAAFTTMSQLPYVGEYANNFIHRLTGELPGLEMRLGRNLPQVSVAIMELLKKSDKEIQAPNFQAEFESVWPEISTDVIPLISVIIPVYNGARFIEEAVDNVLSQNYPRIEIIIVDDGSKDDTEKIVESLDVDVRFFRQPNSGASSARNRGIRDTSGQFIAFLDVDDLWPENNLRHLAEELLTNEDVDVAHGYGQLMEFNSDSNSYEYVGNPKEAFPFYIGAGLYRKSAFEEVGLFDVDLDFAEDTDWYNRANELGLNVKRLDEVTLYVRRHDQNMTRGKNLVELNTLRVFKKALDRKRSDVEPGAH